jgi:hypothetical protein
VPQVLDDAYNLLTAMNDVKQRLEEDLARKKASRNIDTQMNTMKPAIYLTYVVQQPCVLHACSRTSRRWRPLCRPR